MKCLFAIDAIAAVYKADPAANMGDYLAVPQPASGSYGVRGQSALFKNLVELSNGGTVRWF